MGIIMETVMHLKRNFLPLTEGFVYNQIASMKRFKPVVLAIYHRNRNTFPFKDVYAEENLKSFFFMNEIYYRFFKKSPFFDSVLRKTKPLLFHAHFGFDAVYFLPLKKFSIPMITSFYGYDATVYPREHKSVYKKLFENCELFLVPTKSLKADLISLGCDPNKLCVQHLGIDVDRFKFKKRKIKDSTKFLAVARFVEKKGLCYLLFAFSKLAKEFSNVKLTIVGDGPLRNELYDISKRLGLDVKFINNFDYPKPHEVVLNAMYNSDVLVSPSITASNGDKESLNLTNIEAQATGMPVISTWHDGIPEGILDKKTGFLVNEKDIDGPYEKMKYLVENPKVRNRLGKKGRRHVEIEFNLKFQIRKLEDIYAKTIGKKTIS